MAIELSKFSRPDMHDDIAAVLVNEATIAARVHELGAALSKEYAGKDLLLISVLKGSVVFMADLVRSITVPHEIDFMATSSYGAATNSSGVVRILKDLNVSIQGRNILVVLSAAASSIFLVYVIMRILPRGSGDGSGEIPVGVENDGDRRPRVTGFGERDNGRNGIVDLLHIE